MADSSDWYRSEHVMVDALRRDRRPWAVPVIAGYDDLRELARGGQGVVYSAVQQSTHRRIALKVLADRSERGASASWRFEREIDLLASLRHPNIVTVFDSGRTSDDRPFLVMEHIDGRPLDRWAAASQWGALRAGAGSGGRPREALTAVLRLFAGICDGVLAAHQRGVIHRDLKPSNVLVDAAGQPHVLDFGVARATGSDTIGVTTTGGFVGTLAYAAPEQVTGDARGVDVRTDVYALGVMLYELLTGRHPFDVNRPVADVVRAITDVVPPAPSSVWRERKSGVGSRRGPVPIDADLDAIVLTALAKDPGQRYGSVEALRRDLDRFLAGEPVEARRHSTAYVIARWTRRHRVAVIAAAAFLLSLTGFAAAMTGMYRHASAEAEKVRQINLFLEDTLGSAEPMAPGGELSVAELLDEGVRWIDIALADQPEVAAAVHHILGNGYRNIGAYERAEQRLSSALSLRQELFGAEHAEVARSLGALALLRHDQGRLDEAERLYRSALEIRRRTLGPDHLDVAYNLGGLAGVLVESGRAMEAEALLRDSLSIRQRAHGGPHADVAMGQFQLAGLLDTLGRPNEAVELHRAALAMRRSLLNESHPDLPRSLLALADLLIRTGRFSEAEPLLLNADELVEDHLPVEHPLARQARAQLDALYATWGQPRPTQPAITGGDDNR